MDVARHEAAVERRREAWQGRLLPLMVGMLVATALFFAVMSVVELRALYPRVEQRPLDLGTSFAAFEAAQPAVRGNYDYLRFKTLALLEADALHRRYHQATGTMLARVWTRQLGFLTGMVLALVGAAFVLGRLREDASSVELGSGNVRAAIASSSPGLVLATLGAVLMAVTLTVPFGIETRDLATYLGNGTLPTPAQMAEGGRDPGPAPPLPGAP